MKALRRRAALKVERVVFNALPNYALLPLIFAPAAN